MARLCLVKSLHVYPIKGAAGIDVGKLGFDDDGLIVGDRCLMLVDAKTGVFVSQRETPKLARLKSSWSDEPPFDRLTIDTDDSCFQLNMIEPGPTRRVTVWDDSFDAIVVGEGRHDESLSEFLGRAVSLVKLPRRSPRIIDAYWAGENARSSFADLAPVLVTSTSSLADLNARRVASGHALIEMARFRPNVVVDRLRPWAEDEVDSLRIRRGMSSTLDAGVGLRLIKPCARCKVIELDPRDGAPTGDEVLATLARFRAGRNRRGTAGVFFGQNAVVRGGGGWGLSVGDKLTVMRSSDP